MIQEFGNVNIKKVKTPMTTGTDSDFKVYESTLASALDQVHHLSISKLERPRQSSNSSFDHSTLQGLFWNSTATCLPSGVWLYPLK